MNYAMVLAGGKGQRFGDGMVSKQFIELTGNPMLIYSLQTAQKNHNIDEICVVAAEREHRKIHAWAEQYGITKLKSFAKPGKERQQSVYSGLTAIPAKPQDTVIIMTSVCPFVSQIIIDKLYERIQSIDAAITVVKATDAITFSNDGEKVNRTLQKKKLYIQQGPQIFRYGILMAGHKAYMEDIDFRKPEVTEDSELVLNIGTEVAMVLGDRFCVKVTYPEDLAIAESLHGLFEEQERKYAESRNH
ncbi:MAG: 2-C-methyl-D-erythritol 4-phosphate cytidylyltransferase [Clostridium sp.]|jgi:2-C-methyl-D-erythritol 4-phosphate cytidylyltransferase|nr:2-C-methyl-D-erythritol 4-phosphate cytidylyltransferase [Clostridium sp.]